METDKGKEENTQMNSNHFFLKKNYLVGKRDLEENK